MFVWILSVMLVVGNLKYFLVIDYFEVAKSFDQHLCELPFDNLFLVV